MKKTKPSDTLAIRCARALDEKIGENILVLDVVGLTPIADYMVIATANSASHQRALADAIEEELEKTGHKPHHIEGGGDTPWILVDLVDVIIHIFRQDSRKYYDLEHLWGDAKKLAWKTRKPVKKRKK
jgi:ribosome-associated protein